MNIDWSDIGYKAFWTGLSAVLGVLLVATGDLDTWWAVPATMAINSALAWVRQRVAESTTDTNDPFPPEPA